MPDRDLTDALLEVIRARMREQDLSGVKVSERAGILQPTFSKRMGGRGDFTVDEFDALAVAVGARDLEELLEEARRRLK